MSEKCKTGKARGEHMFSALPPGADIPNPSLRERLLCAATTGRSHKDAIDPFRKSIAHRSR
jgi:hypothetical protein